MVNTIFWPILLKKKEIKKWPFLDQNPGFEYRKTHFPGLYCQKKPAQKAN